MRELLVREGARGGRRRSGRMVIRSSNAMYSVRNRVRAFRNGGVRRRRRHREYRALRYRVVYVGAIAVLLRFVVMRLNRNEWEEGSEESNSDVKREEQGGVRRIRSKGVGRRVVMLGLGKGMRGGRGSRGKLGDSYRRGDRWREKSERHRRVDEVERRKERGQYRYTEGMKEVGLAGRVRRVSRLGAVVLTREEGVGESKRQRVNEQLSRDSEKARGKG